MTQDKKWVYRSVDGDFTMGLTPTTTEGVYNKAGTKMLTTMQTPAIQLPFTGGFLTVNETMAKHHKVDIEDLVKLIELSPRFGKTVFLVQAPDFAASKEEIEEVELAAREARKSKAKVVHGARSTKN